MLFGDDGVKEGYPVGSEIEGALWAKIATLKAIYSAKFHANSRQAMKIMARTLLHLEGYYSAATKGSISLNLIKVIHCVCEKKLEISKCQILIHQIKQEAGTSARRQVLVTNSHTGNNDMPI